MKEGYAYTPIPQLREVGSYLNFNKSGVRVDLSLPPYVDANRIGVSTVVLDKVKRLRRYPTFELTNTRQSGSYKAAWGGIYMDIDEIESSIASDKAHTNGLRNLDLWVHELNFAVLHSQIFGPERLRLTYEPLKAVRVWSLLMHKPVFTKLD